MWTKYTLDHLTSTVFQRKTIEIAKWYLFEKTCIISVRKKDLYLNVTETKKNSGCHSMSSERFISSRNYQCIRQQTHSKHYRALSCRLGDMEGIYFIVLFSNETYSHVVAPTRRGIDSHLWQVCTQRTESETFTTPGPSSAGTFTTPGPSSAETLRTYYSQKVSM